MSDLTTQPLGLQVCYDMTNEYLRKANWYITVARFGKLGVVLCFAFGGLLALLGLGIFYASAGASWFIVLFGLWVIALPIIHFFNLNRKSKSLLSRTDSRSITLLFDDKLDSTGPLGSGSTEYRAFEKITAFDSMLLLHVGYSAVVVPADQLNSEDLDKIISKLTESGAKLNDLRRRKG